MSVAIVIPAYNTQSSLTRVLSEIPEALHEGVVVVDDGSDRPIEAPGFRVIRHDQNRGYGAAQKTGYDAALAAGGARGFRAEVLRDLGYHRFSDDYIFDHQVLASLLDRGITIGERKVKCAYDDTVQSIGIGPSIRYAMGVVRTIVRPPPQS